MSKPVRLSLGVLIVLGAAAILGSSLDTSLSRATRGGLMLWGSGAVAVVTTLALVLLLSHKSTLKVRWNEVMPPAQWDFSQSWASNLTLVGALLATVLADSALIPSPTVYLDKETFGTLNVLFAIATALSPLVYVCLGTAGRQGTGMGIVAASCVTLWATLGQLFTLGVLLCEIDRAGRLPPGGGMLVLILIGTGIWLVLTYYWDSVSTLLEHPPQAFAPGMRSSWSPL